MTRSRQGRAIGQAPIGNGADGAAWLDGKAYSANGRDATISVVAETSDVRYEAVATITTARGARTIAAAPRWACALYADCGFQVAAGGRWRTPSRPEAIPVTF